MWLKNVKEAQTLHIVKDVVRHHFIHLSHHPFVHPFDHRSVLSIYSDGVEKSGIQTLNVKPVLIR